MESEHAGEEPTPSAVVNAPEPDVVAERVAYTSFEGNPIYGYLVTPRTADSLDVGGEEVLPGIIMIHEWWGLNDNIRIMARRLADEGYQVLAVDLYEGEVATNSDVARALMQQVMAQQDRSRENLIAAHTYLSEQRGAPQVAALGWCFGGGMALTTALALPDTLDAAVIYYGRLITDRDRLETLQMPILGFFGAEDTGIPVTTVREFEGALNELGKEAQIFVYDGAGHAFANPSGDSYQAEPAEDAWEKTLAFLDQHVRGEGEAQPVHD